MIIEPRRGRFWTYIDPGSNLEQEIIDELASKRPRSEKRVIGWLSENAAGGWTANNKIYYRKGEDFEYIVIKFQYEDDAILFQLKFSEQCPKPIPTPPAWKSWTKDDQNNPREPTFEKWVGLWCCESKNGTCFHWSTGTNLAGFYLTWISEGGEIDEESYRPWTKRKDAIAWARSSAEADGSEG